MTHPTDDELAAYATDPAELPNRADIEAHLAICPACRSDIALLNDAEEGLSEPEVWPDGAPHADDTPPARLQNLIAHDAEIRKENKEARHLLRRPLRSPTAFASLMGRLRTQPKYWTAGVVRLLLEVAHSNCEVDALHAKNVADTAIAISKVLRTDIYSAEMLNGLRGRAWKERANALRVQAQWDEALSALDKAERAYRELRDPLLPLAQVDCIRASILADDEARRHEALGLSRAGAKTFRHFGQNDQYTGARHLEATILFELGEFAPAEIIAREELVYAGESGKALFRARASQLLANIAQARSHSRVAIEHAETALGIFRAAGLDIEVLRTEWVRARGLIGCGDTREGPRELRRIRAEFLASEIPAAAALVTLDLIEHLQEAHQYSDVLSLSRTLVADLMKAGLTTAAVAAATYLRDAATAGGVTPSLLDHLRRFFRRLERLPHLEFTIPT